MNLSIWRDVVKAMQKCFRGDTLSLLRTFLSSNEFASGLLSIIKSVRSV
jgi:hypothetical protein